MSKKIYLAGPYSHDDEKVRIGRFEQLNKIASVFMAEGYFVYSPISHTHPIAMAGSLPLGWDYWEKYDTAFIEWSDELHVAMIPGWMESKGVQAEIKIAEKLGKPVKFIEIDPCDFICTNPPYWECREFGE
jgi:hypothetical protein